MESAQIPTAEPAMASTAPRIQRRRAPHSFAIMTPKKAPRTAPGRTPGLRSNHVLRASTTAPAREAPPVTAEYHQTTSGAANPAPMEPASACHQGRTLFELPWISGEPVCWNSLVDLPTATRPRSHSRRPAPVTRTSRRGRYLLSDAFVSAESAACAAASRASGIRYGEHDT